MQMDRITGIPDETKTKQLARIPAGGAKADLQGSSHDLFSKNMMVLQQGDHANPFENHDERRLLDDATAEDGRNPVSMSTIGPISR
jgi:hypothetical protein